jgi:hypothetical protein
MTRAPTGKGALLSKTEAGYHAPDLHQPCLMCRHFDGYLGTCAVVEGTIRPDASCDHWVIEDAPPERRGFA